MTSEGTTTPSTWAGNAGQPPRGPSAHDILSELQELLAADEAATVIVGIDGTPIDANAAAVTLFGAAPTGPDAPADGQGTLRDVLDQVPQQLLLDPEGGVWRGEIDLTRAGGAPCVLACTVLVRHDATSSSGGFIGVICRDVSDDRLRSVELQHLLE